MRQSRFFGFQHMSIRSRTQRKRRSTEMTHHKGGCHCDRVAWRFAAPAQAVLKCHCENCRRLQGSDYSTWVVVPSNKFELVKGAEHVTEYSTGRSSRSFCSNCGTTVFLNNGKHFPTATIVPLGLVEIYESSLAPQAHVYSDNKADWVRIPSSEMILS